MSLLALQQYSSYWLWLTEVIFWPNYQRERNSITWYNEQQNIEDITEQSHIELLRHIVSSLEESQVEHLVRRFEAKLRKQIKGIFLFELFYHSQVGFAVILQWFCTHVTDVPNCPVVFAWIWLHFWISKSIFMMKKSYYTLNFNWFLLLLACSIHF